MSGHGGQSLSHAYSRISAGHFSQDELFPASRQSYRGPPALTDLLATRKVILGIDQPA
jgi:hypothetical protein